MKPEEFEVYVIPPNFMEGGTLFGGSGIFLTISL